MPYRSNTELPSAVQILPEKYQTIFRNAFNVSYYSDKDESKAMAIGWTAVRNAGYEKSSESPQFEVAKIDEENQFVFGWANIAIRKDGTQIVDYQEDLIDLEDLELAIYQYNIDYRKTGERHQGDALGELIESFVVTPEKLEKMGLAPDALPLGAWVGFYIEDPDIFAKVKDGTYKMFSIQGKAERVPVEEV